MIRTILPFLLDELVGFARNARLPITVVVHDIMPLTHRIDAGQRSAFEDMVSVEMVAAADGERQRLRFAIYAHAVAMTDLVIPVSHASADVLGDWLIRNGHRANQLPADRSNSPSRADARNPRVVPDGLAQHKGAPKQFLSVGTVGVHKNQLMAMAAFQRLSDRRPDLDIRFNVVGLVTPEVADSASQLAKRSKGRIVLHGLLPDKQVEALRKSCLASVFVSLAEGYGLPVAESLWRGQPCICSNDGSIAEIAAGGGCVLVNPQSVEEIEQAFERMATDEAINEGLSREIAVRAHEKLAAIRRRDRRSSPIVQRAVSDGWNDEPDQRRLRQQKAWRRSAVVTLSASDLKIHESYSGAKRSIRKGGAICFEREKHGEIRQEVSSFGPYSGFTPGLMPFRCMVKLAANWI